VDSLFNDLSLLDVHQDLSRNIASLIDRENLFDDLSDSPEDWESATHVATDQKPKYFHSLSPIVHQPFEDAAWDNAIHYPFHHWTKSRYSDGSHGVWYGADTIETSIYESAYHWYAGLLNDAGFIQDGMVSQRGVYAVQCDCVLINLKEKVLQYPQIINNKEYAYCQSIGSRLHFEGHPGLVSRSVRNKNGETYVIFRPQVLSNPRIINYFTYELNGNEILVIEGGKRQYLKISTTFA
jgi:RES domain